MKYIVYEHKFRTTGKSYIGYTSLTIEKRLHKHFTNAIYGMDTKFYRAIRKYGIEDVESIILFECNDESAAKNEEKRFIQDKDTFRTGYNMTLGGDGGNCTLKMTVAKKRKYIEDMKMRYAGDRNPNHSGLTDDEIIDEAVKFFLENKKFIRRRWQIHCKENNIPQNYTRCRFNGKGYSGLIKTLKAKLLDKNIPFSEENFFLSKEERYNQNLQSKISDDYILDKAVEYYLQCKVFSISAWFKFCKDNGLPQTISINRFGGKKQQGFLDQLKLRLEKMDIEFKYAQYSNRFDKI